MVRGGTFTKLKLERGKQYFVNSGAVGQPRDKDPEGFLRDLHSKRLNYRTPPRHLRHGHHKKKNSSGRAFLNNASGGLPPPPAWVYS